MKNLLIVGIDPGTTVAYAILDTKGRLLKIKSSRNLGLSSLIKGIIEQGKVLIIGTDVKIVPQFIEKFASKTGAKIIAPRRNLRIKEKKELVKGYDISDKHEGDALSSALFAYKKVRKLLSKIEYSLSKKNKMHLLEDVIYLVLIKSLSIADAVIALEKKDIPNHKKKRQKSDNRIIESKEIYLKNLNRKLEKRIEFLKKEKDGLIKMMQKIVDTKIKRLMENRNVRFNFLSKELELCKKRIMELEMENRSLLELVKSGKYILIRKVKNLTKPVSDKIIHVENPNVFTEKGLDSVNSNVDVLIHVGQVNKKISERLYPILVSADRADIKNYRGEFFVNKDTLKESKENILDKVLVEYKKERERVHEV